MLLRMRLAQQVMATIVATAGTAYSLVYAAALARRTYRYAEVFGGSFIFLLLLTTLIPALGWIFVARPPPRWFGPYWMWLIVSVGILVINGIFVVEAFEDTVARWHRGW